MTIFSSIVLFHGFGYGRINLRFFVGSDNIALSVKLGGVALSVRCAGGDRAPVAAVSLCLSSLM